MNHFESLTIALERSLSMCNDSQKESLSIFAKLRLEKEFPLWLIQIFRQPNTEEMVKFQAIIQLKNYIEKFWRCRIANPIKMDIQQFIILELEENNFNEKFLPHLSLILSRIARYEYPRKWPELPGTLFKLSFNTQVFATFFLDFLKVLSTQRMPFEKKNYLQESMTWLPDFQRKYVKHTADIEKVVSSILDKIDDKISFYTKMELRSLDDFIELNRLLKITYLLVCNIKEIICNADIPLNNDHVELIINPSIKFLSDDDSFINIVNINKLFENQFTYNMNNDDMYGITLSIVNNFLKLKVISIEMLRDSLEKSSSIFCNYYGTNTFNYLLSTMTIDDSTTQLAANGHIHTLQKHMEIYHENLNNRNNSNHIANQLLQNDEFIRLNETLVTLNLSLFQQLITTWRTEESLTNTIGELLLTKQHSKQKLFLQIILDGVMKSGLVVTKSNMELMASDPEEYLQRNNLQFNESRLPIDIYDGSEKLLEALIQLALPSYDEVTKRVKLNGELANNLFKYFSILKDYLFSNMTSFTEIISVVDGLRIGWNFLLRGFIQQPNFIDEIRKFFIFIQEQLKNTNSSDLNYSSVYRLSLIRFFFTVYSETRNLLENRHLMKSFLKDTTCNDPQIFISPIELTCSDQMDEIDRDYMIKLRKDQEENERINEKIESFVNIDFEEILPFHQFLSLLTFHISKDETDLIVRMQCLQIIEQIASEMRPVDMNHFLEYFPLILKSLFDLCTRFDEIANREKIFDVVKSLMKEAPPDIFIENPHNEIGDGEKMIEQIDEFLRISWCEHTEKKVIPIICQRIMQIYSVFADLLNKNGCNNIAYSILLILKMLREKRTEFSSTFQDDTLDLWNSLLKNIRIYDENGNETISYQQLKSIHPILFSSINESSDFCIPSRKLLNSIFTLYWTIGDQQFNKEQLDDCLKISLIMLDRAPVLYWDDTITQIELMIIVYGKEVFTCPSFVELLLFIINSIENLYSVSKNLYHKIIKVLARCLLQYNEDVVPCLEKCCEIEAKITIKNLLDNLFSKFNQSLTQTPNLKEMKLIGCCMISIIVNLMVDMGISDELEQICVNTIFVLHRSICSAYKNNDTEDTKDMFFHSNEATIGYQGCYQLDTMPLFQQRLTKILWENDFVFSTPIEKFLRETLLNDSRLFDDATEPSFMSHKILKKVQNEDELRSLRTLFMV